MNTVSDSNNIRLCIASVVRTIVSCRTSNSAKFEHVCKAMLHAINPLENKALPDPKVIFPEEKDVSLEIEGYGTTNYQSIHQAKCNLAPTVISYASRIDPLIVRDYLAKQLEQYLDERGRKKVIRALFSIIELDPEIDEDECVGSLERLRKKSFESVTTVNFDNFITDVFLNSIRRRNTYKKDLTDALSKDFYKKAIENHERLKLVKIDERQATKAISITTKGSFDSIFEEITAAKLGIQVRHDYKLFALRDIEFEIHYDALARYLQRNLGSCILSRSHIKNRMTNDEIDMVGYDAFSRIANTNHEDLDSLVGDLLLHIFLEQVLGAPKLLNQIESGNANAAQKNAVAIHLLSATNKGMPFNEFVYGSSFVTNGLKEAIDVALTRLANAENTQFHRSVALEPSLLNQMFPEEDAKTLLSILVPNFGEHQNLPVKAYGVFLGYSPEKIPERSKGLDFFKAEYRRQIENDMRDVIPFLEDQISIKGLEGYSIYIYILPFNNADDDKAHIVDLILNKGRGL